jgi:hypothetical protein
MLAAIASPRRSEILRLVWQEGLISSLDAMSIRLDPTVNCKLNLFGRL